MAIEIKVPDLGESVVEATVARWLKQEGEQVKVGEPVVELETDKVNLEVGAEKDGVLATIARGAGDDVKVGDVLGTFDERAAAQPEVAQPQAAKPPVEGAPQAKEQAEAPVPVREAAEPREREAERAGGDGKRATPVARRLAQDQNVDLAAVQGTGPGARVTKEDVERYVSAQQTEPAPTAAQPVARPAAVAGDRREDRVKMSRRRRTIAKRLVEAQQTAAMLTTFNEIDMSAVKDLRARHKQSFQERHGVSLGITSFFVKAAVGALEAYPVVNAEVDGDDMILKYFYDIGIAIGDPEGLIVPVLRDADRMSFPEIERAIRTFAQQAQDRTLSLDDLRGGTFTITNGGIFGSMLSTPILNPPQVGILGLHNIVDRPVVVDGQIAIRPIMYVALSYDHRLVDGREAVQFLVRVKELIEDPAALLLEG